MVKDKLIKMLQSMIKVMSNSDISEYRQGYIDACNDILEGIDTQNQIMNK